MKRLYLISNKAKKLYVWIDFESSRGWSQTKAFGFGTEFTRSGTTYGEAGHNVSRDLFIMIWRYKLTLTAKWKDMRDERR